MTFDELLEKYRFDAFSQLDKGDKFERLNSIPDPGLIVHAWCPKDAIINNSQITISNILAKAYEYGVNGRSVIEWIMERYQITVHKDSGTRNDPNDWSTEVGNPRYTLDLLLSVINVSTQTVEIVEELPKMRFD